MNHDDDLCMQCKLENLIEYKYGMFVWRKPENGLPPQAKKILYLKDGDCYVVQRFSNYWIPIPFSDSVFAKLDPPDYWCDIHLPCDLNGLMKFKLDVEDREYTREELEKEKLYTLDEVEEMDYEAYMDIVRFMVDTYKNAKKDGKRRKK